MLSQFTADPLMGIELANATEVTPGIAASLSTISFWKYGSFRLRDQREDGIAICTSKLFGVLEPRVNGPHRLEGTNHQACTHQQDQGHSDLRYHEQVAGAMTLPTPAGSPSCTSKSGGDSRSRIFPRRDQSKHES